MSDRYSRQTMLPEIGPEGQRRFAEASVLIVGVGGLGSVVATYLTGAGVGRIGLADPDVVSVSNLQRQVLYTEAEVGLRKVEMAQRRLSAQSAATQFDLWTLGLTEENAEEIIGQYDLVVDCTDNFPVRFLIDDVTARLGKPWVHGSIGEFAGQVAVFNHLSGLRYADLYDQREQLCAQPRTVSGVVGAVPGVIGAIQASEALKLIAGYGESLDGKLFIIDLKTLHTNLIQLT